MASYRINVMHVALTPLAGSPIRIVDALNRHTSVRARLVVLNPDQYGARVYENDLTWGSDKEEALELLEQCDVIHLHHFVDLKSNPFGVDFADSMKAGKAIIRQFQTHPATVADIFKCPVGDVINDPLPQLILAQFHERYYPRARLVPQIIPLNGDDYQPARRVSDSVTVFFAPTVQHSAWKVPEHRTRWDTKGYPETLALLGRIRSDVPTLHLDVGVGLPHHECLRRRRGSDISIDEMITGSYHISSLEGLAQGVPTLAYLDERTLAVLREIAGADNHPWINVRLEDAEAPLRCLIEDRELREGLGTYSRQWMEKYWDDAKMVRHYVRAYEDLLEHPDVYRQFRFDPDDRRTTWFTRELHEAAWRSRRQRALAKVADGRTTPTMVCSTGDGKVS